MSESLTELQNIWSQVLERLKIKIADQKAYDAFLHDTYIYSINNKDINIVFNSDLSVRIANDQWKDVVKSAIKEVVGSSYNPVFGLKSSFKSSDSVNTTTNSSSINNNEHKFFVNSVLNPNLVFDNFVTGESNLEAYQAAIFVRQDLGKYNPLFIYGPSGVGKTHLLSAIGNYINTNIPGKSALYCTSDDFIMEYISYVSGSKGIDRLKEFIFSHDVFLIDDIQSIGGKEKTEDYFFQVFNALYNRGKQIIITSDKHPDELKGFANRLSTRFTQGLPVSIKMPDTSTCVEILKTKISTSPLDINNFDEDVLQFIAKNFSKSVRSLDQALNKLIFYTTSFRPTKHIDLDITMEALQSLIDVKDARQKLNEQKIINTVAEYYHVSPSQLVGKSRPANITVPRHIAMYLIKNMLDTPYTGIGFIFGGKDHSTVMSGVKKVENELKNSPTLQNVISEIKSLLK